MSFGHRTLFFRDPDGNVLEIYAEIQRPGLPPEPIARAIAAGS